MSYHKTGRRETRCFECGERAEGDVEVRHISTFTGRHVRTKRRWQCPNCGAYQPVP